VNTFVSVFKGTASPAMCASWKIAPDTLYTVRKKFPYYFQKWIFYIIVNIFELNMYQTAFLNLFSHMKIITFHPSYRRNTKRRYYIITFINLFFIVHFPPDILDICHVLVILYCTVVTDDNGP
jgi:hypothetical protein